MHIRSSWSRNNHVSSASASSKKEAAVEQPNKQRFLKSIYRPKQLPTTHDRPVRMPSAQWWGKATASFVVQVVRELSTNIQREHQNNKAGNSPVQQSICTLHHFWQGWLIIQQLAKYRKPTTTVAPRKPARSPIRKRKRATRRQHAREMFVSTLRSGRMVERDNESTLRSGKVWSVRGLRNESLAGIKARADRLIEK